MADISTPEDSPINSTSEDTFEVAPAEVDATSADTAPADAASTEVGGTESVNSETPEASEAPEAAAAPKVDLAEAIDAVPFPEFGHAASATGESETAPAEAGEPLKRHPRLSWVRHGHPISSWQLKKAAGRYHVAILNPWELRAAHNLKKHNPHMKVLAYKNLSSVPTATAEEKGPIYTSGIHPIMARNLGTSARLTRRVAHKGRDHQRVWDLTYQQAWLGSVAAELADSPFDGVVVDSDLDEKFFRHELDREQMYGGIEKLFSRAGERLGAMGKMVVPNFPARDGNWRGQGRFGGVFESNWLGWGGAGDGWLSADECVEQARRLNEAEGQIILRAPGANRNYIRHLGLALAAAWVFFPQREVSVAATGADDFNGVPLVPEVDLGDPTSDVIRDGDLFRREFTGGVARINLSETTSIDGLRPHSGSVEAS